MSSVPNGAIQIVADTALHQLAIQQNVIHPADDDDPRAGIANLSKLIQPLNDIGLSGLGSDDDDIRRRRMPISFGGCRHAAHLDLQMGFGKPAISPAAWTAAAVSTESQKAWIETRGTGAI